MLDFTSALYLGMRHDHGELRPWPQLTTGRPAGLLEPPEASSLAQEIAWLQHCERATLAPSTLHLFWDLFDMLAREPIAIYMDAGTYPIARWGIERVVCKGVRVQAFPSHDAAALEALLARDRGTGTHPVVVADGLSPATGRTAPLRHYLACARRYGGTLVVDDTQAFGVLGSEPGAEMPYGRGGGGSTAFHGLRSPALIVGISLAKAFGVPLAALSGSAGMIARFEDTSATREHCSPPSAAAFSAARHALDANARGGDRLRRRLLHLVLRFREELGRIGLATSGGLFPVQTIMPIPGVDPMRLHRCLLRCGVGTVLHEAHGAGRASISFLITALHAPAEIVAAAAALRRACRLARQERAGTSGGTRATGGPVTERFESRILERHLESSDEPATELHSGPVR